MRRIERASKFYILGYGFDETNNERIGLTHHRDSDRIHRSVFFTSFGGHNRVNKAAERALFGSSARFASGGTIQSDSKLMDSSLRGRRFEMSTKNVYDALNEDFESLETD